MLLTFLWSGVGLSAGAWSTCLVRIHPSPSSFSLLQHPSTANSSSARENECLTHSSLHSCWNVDGLGPMQAALAVLSSQPCHVQNTAFAIAPSLLWSSVLCSSLLQEGYSPWSFGNEREYGGLVSMSYYSQNVDRHQIRMWITASNNFKRLHGELI